MNVLITGGCGFVGSNLAARVIERGDSLIVLDNLFRDGSAQNLEWLKTRGEFEYCPYDIRDSDQLDNVVKSNKPDYIFHLAGQVAMTTSIANPKIDFEINALGTFNLLEAVRKYSPESIILYSSTNKVYGELEYFTYKETDTRYVCVEHPEGFDESVSLDFRSPYGCSKGTADQYLLDYYRIFGIRTVVFRHSTMYGGNQNATFDQGWISWFVQKALDLKIDPSVKPFTIAGSGKQVRDILFVEDVCELYYRAVENISNCQGRAYNIGGGIKNSLSLLELFSILDKKLNIRMKYKRLEARQSDQLVFISNNSKVTNDLNWLPEHSIMTGLNNTITASRDWK